MVNIIKREVGSWTAPADTNENTLVTFVIPVGTVKTAFDSLHFHCFWEVTNNANAKTFRVKLNGNVIQGFSIQSFSHYNSLQMIHLNNSFGQIIHAPININGYSGSTGTIVTASVDFTAPVTVTITMQKGTAGDTARLRAYDISLRTIDEGPVGSAGASLDSQPTYNLYTFLDGKTTRKDWK